MLPMWSSELLPKCRQYDPGKSHAERCLEWSEVSRCASGIISESGLGSGAGELVARFERDEIAGYVWFGKGGRKRGKGETGARTAYK
jgi:hypothetical protein